MAIERDQLYTSAEMAAFFKVHPRTLQAWLQAGVIPGAFKRGKGRARWYIYGRDLLTQDRQTAEPDTAQAGE